MLHLEGNPLIVHSEALQEKKAFCEFCFNLLQQNKNAKKERTRESTKKRKLTTSFTSNKKRV